MRIAISGYAADAGKSGIGQYMAAVIGRLPRLAPNDRFVVFVDRASADLVRSWSADLEVVTFPDWTAHPVASIFWHLVWLPWAVRRARCDVVFMPAGNRRLAWRYAAPSVGTVHDMSQLHVPQKYDPMRMFYVTRMLPSMMRRLTRVVSVSESTRRDLVESVGVPAERIRVIPNGADVDRFHPRDRLSTQATVRERYDVASPFLLYISRLEHPGKNHVRLLEAFAELRRTAGLPHKLVLVGSRWSGAETIEARVRELALQDDVVFPGFVANDDLPLFYVAADALVFPSLFEGFGIPLIEAMASGTPVCASEVSSIPEVVDDAGVLFDPLQPSSIAAAIRNVLLDEGLRHKLVHRGLERVRRFSWDRAARDVLAEIEAAAGR